MYRRSIKQVDVQNKVYQFLSNTGQLIERVDVQLPTKQVDVHKGIFSIAQTILISLLH
jgi:hypothetical protein